MIINRSDLTEGHDLWSDQEVGFDPEEFSAKAKRRDFSVVLGHAIRAKQILTHNQCDFGLVRDRFAIIAVRMTEHAMAIKQGLSYAEYCDLPEDEKVSALLDLEDDFHEHIAKQSKELTVGKGPGGRWFVKRGRDRVAGGFDTEAQASEESAKIAAAD